MTDHIISPDGKLMWSGSEWIPVPPNGNYASVSMQDSVVAGDVNITQNNSEDIANAMVQALERVGFSGQSSPAELTPSQAAEVEQVLEISEQLVSHGIEIDPWTEITVGNAARLAGRTHDAQQHFLRALETFRKNDDREGEAISLGNLGVIALRTRGDLAEAERLQRESLAIAREIGYREGEARSLGNLGNLSYERGDLAEAERLQRESLAIKREIGDREGESTSLNNLGNLSAERGDLAEAERLMGESLAIAREIGYREVEATSLGNLGNLSYERGDLAEAERLMGESLAIEREIGDRGGDAPALSEEQVLARMKGEKEFPLGRFAVVSVVTIGVLLTSIFIWESAGLPAELLKGTLLIIFFPLLLLSIAKNRKKR